MVNETQEVSAVKRENAHKSVTHVFLLAAKLQLAICLHTTASLYLVSLIYRLNQSKVYV